MYSSIQQGFIYIIYAASLLSEGERIWISFRLLLEHAITCNLDLKQVYVDFGDVEYS